MSRKEFDTSASIKMVSAGAHWHHEGAVGTSEVVIDMTGAPINTIVYLINDDSTNDLFVDFDGSVSITAAVTNGADGTIRIKAGEALTDMPRFTQKVRLRRAAGSGTVRFLGV